MAETSAHASTSTTELKTSNETSLFVGNLAPSVTEYTLVQLFSKYGKIVRFDYLFHKSGPLAGQPRGFAFVDFATPQEALNAKIELHDKLVRGKRITVKHSTSAPPDPNTLTKRFPSAVPPKPTRLSLIKDHRPETTSGKIKALEAKLAGMKRDQGQSQDKGTDTVQESSLSSSPIVIPPDAKLPRKPV